MQSQKFMVEYDKMANILHEEKEVNFTLARVNSANQQNQGITAHYKVKSFPHLFYFHKLVSAKVHTRFHTHLSLGAGGGRQAGTPSRFD